MKIPIILLTLIFIFACHSEPVMDLVPVVRLEKGAVDTVNIDELFYAPVYKTRLMKAPNLNVTLIPNRQLLICSAHPDFSGITFITIENNGNTLDIPVVVEKKNEVRFRFKPPESAKNVFVMGTFNSWNRTADPLHDGDGDGIFEATLLLDEGVYEYQFVYDKTEVWDKQNPDKVDNGFGGYNSLLRVTSSEKNEIPNLYFAPRQQFPNIHITVACDGYPTKDLIIYMLLDNRLLDEKIWFLTGNVMEIDLLALKLQDRHCLRIFADRQGAASNILKIWLQDGKPLSDDYFIWQDAIVYSLMIDRFCDGDPGNNRPVIHPQLDNRANFKGGDFSGIQKKLTEGYFKTLGINTIWISPVTKTTDKAYQEWPEPKRFYSGYHGYWPVRSDSTESRFGSLDQFIELVRKAHNQELKILLDFISNHTHIEHVFYQKHPEWYGSMTLPNGEMNIRLWEAYRLTTWFDTFLPSFDYIASVAALEKITDNALFWLSETHIDGFRHDATKHVPYLFWKKLNKKIKSKVNPQRSLPVYQVGETFGGHDLIKSYVNNGMLDAQFNFEQFFTARRVFVEQNANFEDLALALEKSLSIYGNNHLMGNIMDSHDQARMIALLEGDLTLAEDAVQRAWQDPLITVDDTLSYRKARVVLTYILTIPGVPIIYYGDEIGMTGAGDPDNRRMMRFEGSLSAAEQRHFSEVKKLIHLRKNHSALRRGDYLTILADKDLYIYSRGDLTERLLIALNKSNAVKKIQLQLPEWLTGTRAESLLDMDTIDIENNEITLQLPTWSGKVYLLK
jgi:cyclomaltodextrinase